MHPPTIDSGEFDLPPEIEAVLRSMFAGYKSVLILDEFGRGYGGSRVFKVQPSSISNTVQLPRVVKIGPAYLIQKEAAAYEQFVKGSIAKAISLESAPDAQPDRELAGLNYTLAGGDIDTIQSMGDYYQTAPDDDFYQLFERVLQVLEDSWWSHIQSPPMLRLRAEYDLILPVNLLLKPIDPAIAAQEGCITLDAQAANLRDISRGDYVHLRGFVVDKINHARQELSLNAPSGSPNAPSHAYRVRFKNLPGLAFYEGGKVVPSIYGVVTETRQTMLKTQLETTLFQSINLDSDQLPFSSELTLPNPLLNYHKILDTPTRIRTSTIHGDLNLENILIIQDKMQVTKDFNLIDFATVRHGHVLHDFLRLETEIVIMTLPLVLNRANLDEGAIVMFLEQLYDATQQANWTGKAIELPHPTLQKPFRLTLLIRRTAQRYLRNHQNWEEYYRGLVIYFLGVLKFKSIWLSDISPNPKQLAFWGAATVQALQDPKMRETLPQATKDRRQLAADLQQAQNKITNLNKENSDLREQLRAAENRRKGVEARLERLAWHHHLNQYFIPISLMVAIVGTILLDWRREGDIVFTGSALGFSVICLIYYLWIFQFSKLDDD